MDTAELTGTIWNDATGTLAQGPFKGLSPYQGPDTMPHRIALSNSTAGKSAPMQVVKQPEQGRASTNHQETKMVLLLDKL